jgi:hypothetical protein
MQQQSKYIIEYYGILFTSEDSVTFRATEGAWRDFDVTVGGFLSPGRCVPGKINSAENEITD